MPPCAVPRPHPEDNYRYCFREHITVQANTQDKSKKEKTQNYQKIQDIPFAGQPNINNKYIKYHQNIS